MAWVRLEDSTSKSYLKHISALGHTQPPIQWVPRALSLRVKWPGCEADHSPQKMPRSRLMDLYIHCPIRLHGVVLRQLGTGTTLKLKLIYDWQSVGQSVLVPGSHLGPMTRFLLSFWRLRVSWYGTPSLTRGWVCNLFEQLLLGLARTVTLRSKSLRSHGHILVSHLRFSQPGGPGPRIYIPPGTGWPSYTPGHWVPFLSPLATRRAVVEVF
jgi:hypothetical protein